MLPASLCYLGWGGQTLGSPADLLLVGLFTALGVAVHVLVAVPVLGVRPQGRPPVHLPLWLGLRLGAQRLRGLVWTPRSRRPWRSQYVVGYVDRRGGSRRDRLPPAGDADARLSAEYADRRTRTSLTTRAETRSRHTRRH